MKMQNVESTCIKAAGYERKTLNLQFKDSEKTYAYAGVPKTLFEQLKKADSKGRFFLQHIKPKFKGVVVAA